MPRGNNISGGARCVMHGSELYVVVMPSQTKNSFLSTAYEQMSDKAGKVLH